MNDLSGKRILFFVPQNDVLRSGVYHSQVLEFAQYLVTQGCECLVLHTDTACDDKYEVSEKGVVILNCPNVPGRYYLPFVPLKLRRIVNPWMDRIKEFAPTHVYARNSYAGIAAKSLARRLRAKFVFSCRGAGLALSDTSFVVHVKEWLLWWETWRSFRAADHVSSVCENLRRHVREFYHYKGPDSVFPGSAATDKFAIATAHENAECRKSLGFPEDAIIIVYSGSIGWYQDIDGILTLMREMHVLDERLMFLLQVKDEVAVRAAAGRIGLPSQSYRVVYSRPEDVGRYLKIATAAFALRTDDEITRLASPIKIGEYLASGLGVIANPWIGDLKEILKDKCFAFLYDGTQSAEEIVKFVNFLDAESRNLARQLGRAVYSYDGNRDAILKMFD